MEKKNYSKKQLAFSLTYIIYKIYIIYIYIYIYIYICIYIYLMHNHFSFLLLFIIYNYYYYYHYYIIIIIIIIITFISSSSSSSSSIIIIIIIISSSNINKISVLLTISTSIVDLFIWFLLFYIPTHFLSLPSHLRDCQQITFVTLNRFCPLSKNPIHPPCS